MFCFATIIDQRNLHLIESQAFDHYLLLDSFSFSVLIKLTFLDFMQSNSFIHIKQVSSIATHFSRYYDISKSSFKVL